MRNPGKHSEDIQILDEILARFGKEPEYAIPLLQEVQATYGYLPKHVLEHIAKVTNITATQIYGVATFFKQFHLTAPGRHIIKVCHGTACHVGGAERITQTISDELGIKEGETTPDGEFTLEVVACLGCCSLSPVVMIDKTVYGRLTSKSIKKILKETAGQKNGTDKKQ